MLGLLQASFRPDAEMALLRAYLRHRAELIQHRAPHILHLQQALHQMNIQLDRVLADITGTTGMAILRAIVAGERDPLSWRNCAIRPVARRRRSSPKRWDGIERRQRADDYRRDWDGYDEISHGEAFWVLVRVSTAQRHRGRVLRSRTQKVVNRAAQAFRQAAQAVARSDSAIGAFYRAMRARKGPQQANVATAHKLARIVYHLLNYGGAYEAERAEDYDRKRQERELRAITRRANKLGYTLTQLGETTPRHQPNAAQMEGYSPCAYWALRPSIIQSNAEQ